MCSTHTMNDLGLSDKDHNCTCGTSQHAEALPSAGASATREH